jgi:hypothetical protein
VPEAREYKSLLPVDESLDWKWTRHFLASKAQSSEWIMEGVVPEPIVMLVQQRRYWLERDPSANGKHKNSTGAKSHTPRASGQ